MTLTDRYFGLQDRVAQAAKASARSTRDITVLAVSKRHTDEAVESLAELGHRDFGENQVQAWTARLDTFPALRWHLVGALQTNKATAIEEGQPTLVHTVDRLKLVVALSRRWNRPTPLDVLIQVNIDDEPQKAGCTPDGLDALADHVAKSTALRLRGLMCIPKPVDAGAPRDAFARTRLLLDTVRDRVQDTPILSMGMSDDFEAAIAEGSTLIRIGTALFGRRAD
jgi:pyridoxal phosphate enzyme (YggS family)